MRLVADRHNRSIEVAVAVVGCRIAVTLPLLLPLSYQRPYQRPHWHWILCPNWRKATTTTTNTNNTTTATTRTRVNKTKQIIWPLLLPAFMDWAKSTRATRASCELLCLILSLLIPYFNIERSPYCPTAPIYRTSNNSSRQIDKLPSIINN